MSESNVGVFTDLEKYVLEQAKIEVEHTRSWPAKILAFYVATVAGVVTAVFSLSLTAASRFYVPCCAKLLITIAVLGLLLWAFVLLRKNHHSYLKHRKIQVYFQKKHEASLKEIPLPAEWFTESEVSITTRWAGWGFYFYLMSFVTLVGLAGVWAV